MCVSNSAYQRIRETQKHSRRIQYNTLTVSVACAWKENNAIQWQLQKAFVQGEPMVHLQCNHVTFGRPKRMQDKKGDAPAVWGHEMNEWPLWAGLRPRPSTVEQKLSVFWRTVLSKDRLWSIHHSSTCNQLMEPLTVTLAVKERDDGGVGGILNREPSFVSETALKLCFVSKLSAIISISCLHESGGGGRGGDRRVQTFFFFLKNPFTQPGVVTWIQWDTGEGHSTLKQPSSTAHVPTPTDMLSQPFLGGSPLRLSRAVLPPSFTLSQNHHCKPCRSTSPHWDWGESFFLEWTVCVHTELQMNCRG